VAGPYVYVGAGDYGLAIVSSCEGLLFADGFETGDTSRWAAVIP
jgi:hypothetical protein